MENITTSYSNRAEIWILLTILIYFLMNGAQIFETVVFIPKWTATPPESLSLLANKHGVSLKSFWTIFHSLHEVIFIITVILCWKIAPVRNWLIILFLIHFSVRVWTLLYFVPNILDFQAIFESSDTPKYLVERVALWQKLNYLRLVLFFLVSLGLVPLLFRIVQVKNSL